MQELEAWQLLRALDVMGPRFAQIYGQGETPMTATALARHHHVASSHPRWLERLGSVGVAQTPVQVRVADAMEHWGTDSGAMHVRVACRNADGTREHCMLTLVAEQGDGPQIPATPAVILVKKLLGLDGYAPLALRGAKPCMGMFTSAELMREFAGFAIRFQSGA